ncbi:fumarate hydratase, class I [Strigomonas culicis]|uniref:Fumarate hydratase, class I n=1 Tax=Strigomonas culicis TaxID=28005 RepID=S9U4F5_9TRYP|nr:fumarate hydratase, class I [Strigomonas culicis]EPY23828.1 fumarate hydratase, class I [Strigomonas culicis]|eukprot:EPY21250.1 fumarate hydratase, class I [Strigomonas culicis]
MIKHLCEECELACHGDGMTDIEDTKARPDDFTYAPIFRPHDPKHEEFEYYKMEGSEQWVSEVDVMGRKVLQVQPEALTAVAHQAFSDVHHYFRRDHLEGWRHVLDDPEASDNDRYVARTLLHNACIASGLIMPSCQDTGTAIVLGKRGELCWTGGEDEALLSKGIWECYTHHNLRYSQTAALDMFKECNTGNNLPAQLDLLAVPGNEYEFMFVAKGGGSANKSYLYQQTKALLNPKSPARLCAGEAEDPRHRGLPAVPHRPRHWRHERRDDDEDGEAGQLPLLRLAAHHRRQDGPRLPRHGVGGDRHEHRAGERHRRPVWRQVLCPPGPRDPPAAPRRVLPRRPRRVLQRGPPDPRAHQHGGRLHRAAHPRPRRVPPGRPQRRDERRVRHGGPRAAHDGDPQAAQPVPDRHAPHAQRHPHRRPRHRAREGDGDAR